MQRRTKRRFDITRKVISEREEELPPSMIGELLRVAGEDKSVVSLGPGEPDFQPPRHVIEAACKSVMEGYTRYSPSAGRYRLREAIARKLKKENRIDASPDQVIVTTGSTEAIMLALMCAVDPGEGVMIPDPGFLAYGPTVEILNGMPISVPHNESSGFQFVTEEAEKAIIPEKTNVMIVNTPSNPTGAVYRRKALEEVADFVCEHDLLAISDEAYEKLVYAGERHVSLGSLNGMADRVLTLHSFSKTYAMPGFRVGYAAGPEKLIKAMSKLHIYTSVCAPTVSQLAALAALTGPQGFMKKMLVEYDRRRKLMHERLNEIQGFSCVEPKGAFYAFPNIKDFMMKSADFSGLLLKRAKVAVVPGSEFGRNGEGHIRLSFATSYDKIDRAMGMIERVAKTLKRH